MTLMGAIFWSNSPALPRILEALVSDGSETLSGWLCPNSRSWKYRGMSGGRLT
jgi:hypothetical protein